MNLTTILPPPSQTPPPPVSATDVMTVLNLAEATLLPNEDSARIKTNVKTITTTTTKNILNWLKNTTINKTKSDSCENKANSRKSVEVGEENEECTCSKVKFERSTRDKYKTTTNNNNNKHNNKHNNNILSNSDEILRDFCGVQTLRRLWNKRIIANKEFTLQAKTFQVNNNFTKSVDCLVNAANTGKPPTPTSTPSPLTATTKLIQNNDKKIEGRRPRTIRAHSLHDCSLLERNIFNNCAKFSTESLDNPLSDLDLRIHLTKDNFYKYKTAEQASKLREQSEITTKLQKQYNNRNYQKITKDEKGEEEEEEEVEKSMLDPIIKVVSLPWLECHSNSCSKQLSEDTTNMAIRELNNDNCKSYCDNVDVINSTRHNTTTISTSTTTTIISLDNTANTMRGKKCQQLCEMVVSTVPTMNESQNNNSSDTPSNTTTSQVSQSENVTQSSTITVNNNNFVTKSYSPSRRKRCANSATTRKYSFKTHSRSCCTRSYPYTPRKMATSATTINNKESITTATNITNNHQFSLVAQLTQQFNAIIRKDNALLADVKRKNGILMTRGGHVYKVVQADTFGNKTSDSNVQRSNSKVRDKCAGKQQQLPKTNTTPSNVQKTIKKFEKCKISNVEKVKPKVPTKSLQVLKKSCELALNRYNSTSSTNNQQLLLDSLVRSTEYNEKIGNDSYSKEKIEKSLTPTLDEVSNNSNEQCLTLSLDKKMLAQNDPQNIAKTQINKKLKEDFKVEEIQQRQDIFHNEFEELKPEGLKQVIIIKAASEETPLDKDIDKILNKSNQQHINLTLDKKSSEQNYIQNIEILKSDTKVMEDHETREKELKEDVHQQKTEEIKLRESEEGDENNHTDVELTSSPTFPTAELTMSEDSGDEEKFKQRKQKYAEIYEKIRVRTLNNHKKSSLEQILESHSKASQRTRHSKIYDAKEECSEVKILNALEIIDEKIKNLKLNLEPNIIPNDTEHILTPNKSFVYSDNSSSSKSPVKSDCIQITQAVNVILVNSNVEEAVIDKNFNNVESNEDSEPLYEPIAIPKDEEKEQKNELKTEEDKEIIAPGVKSFLYKSFKETIERKNKNISLLQNAEELYQTVEEALHNSSNNTSPLMSKEKMDDYELIEDTKLNETLLSTEHSDDGYEECSPSTNKDVEKISFATMKNNSAVRNTTDELPELPELPKSKRYSIKTPLPYRKSPKTYSSTTIILNPSQSSSYYAEEENIYDTIKGSDCYESLSNNKVHSKHIENDDGDTFSLISNGYESISHYRRNNMPVKVKIADSCNGSTLTISSEQKTNSLYEDSIILSTLLRYNKPMDSSNTMKRLHRTSVRSETEGCKSGSSTSSGSIIYVLGSDNSDEWMDITDNENNEEVNSTNPQPQFIVIRERSKPHKSPDWSKRVRDKRLNIHQRNSTSCIDDDSDDHYYEQLSSQNISSKRHSLHAQEKGLKNGLQRNSVRISQKDKQFSYSAHALGQTLIDEYDSFDTDFEETYESEGCLKDVGNDSGVDIGNVKLPEPSAVTTTQPTNQMYAMVKRFKNFIVNKKSPQHSKQKIYDNASQFYVTNNNNNNNLLANERIMQNVNNETSNTNLTKELSNSEKNLLSAGEDQTKKCDANNTATTPRTKTKPNKSLRSRIRKSLVGFDTKQLASLTPPRSTFYVEDPYAAADDGNGEMDSGFSEKTPTADVAFVQTSSASPAQELPKCSTLNRKAHKDTKLSHSQRRRTTIGLRPHEPPPPPPPATTESNAGKTLTRQQSNTTSWYAECGVFKNGTTTQLTGEESHLTGGGGKNPLSLSGSGNIIACGSSWYEEVGLYQTSGRSEASSSGSSGVSTGNEVSTADDLSHSTVFSNEPLYQIYTAAKLEAISRDMAEPERDSSSTDGYEEVGERLRNNIQQTSRDSQAENRRSVRPSALQLVEPKTGPARTLWCQIPEVINSCILDAMTPRERALMEAKFEIITSEASYMKSLNLLRTHYMNHPIFRDTNLLNTRDRKSLFAHIVPVHECSEKLLTELESCWQDNIMLVGLSKRMYAIAEKHFHVYVGFCENQGRMDRTLKRLREGKGLFSQNLELLESSPTSCGLSLHSFLMLPMQRITRLPLLIDAVFSKCHPNDDEYESWKMCLAMMNKVVTQCNEAANRCEQAYEIEKISRQLEFNANVIRPLAIVPAGVAAPGSKPRYLVKRGDLTHLIWRGDDAKLTFGKKFTKSSVYAFLFSDLLVLTKRKSDEHFSVFDYCPRSMLTISSGDALPQLPTKDLNSQTNKNLILMTLLENHERKTVEMIFSCPSVSEQERWLQAMRPLTAETPGEKLYEEWDCPQVITKHVYKSNEPDVLNLEVGDIINVTRKLPDGWYQGERIRDGAIGWFPGTYTEEVNSAHVRARNLKQRHRLLTFTATYLESQKRHK